MADVFDVSGTVRLDTRRAEKDLSRFVRKAEAVDLKLAINDRNFTQPLGRITGAAQEFNKSLAASNARVVAFAASAGLLYAVQRAFIAMAQAAVEVEHTLKEINVIMGVSEKNLGKFGDQLFRVAAQTGQSFSTVATAATELARQGLTMEETLKRTRDSMILVRLAGMDAESAVNALTAAVNSFNKVALDSTEIVNKMANVDAAFAVSTNDLAEAMKRVGSSAIDAGVSFDQLLAITTSVQQVTARGGAVIGNSLKSIFTRIQRTEVLDQLESLGFQVRNLKGETMPALKIMTDLAKNIDRLTAAQKASVTEMMGGVFQINVVKAALGDLGKEYSIYENALRTSINTTDEAISRNAELNETLQSLVNKTFQNVQKAAAAVGKLTLGPALERVLGGVNAALEKFDPKSADSIGAKVGVGIMEGLGKFISGPGLVVGIALIGKLLINFSKFIGDSFREFFKLNEAAKGRLAIEEMVTKELGESEELTQAILRGELSVIDAEEIILKNLQERVKQQEKLNQLIKSAAYGLEKKGVKTSPIEGTDEYSVRPPRATNKGFIPRYSEGNVQDLVRDELKGASYTNNSSRAIIDTLPGIGKHVRNSEENVVYAKGMKSPFINPPLNSPEGKSHRDNAIRQTGINPYSLSSWGFVPGFARGKKTGKREAKTKENTKTLQAKKKGEGVVLPTRGASYNTTFNETTSAVFAKSPQDKAAWKEAGVEHWTWKGPRVAQLRGPEDKISDFDKIIDAALEGGIQTVGKHLAGNDIDIEKKSGKFSQWFDSAGWPQVRGRVFEAGLNYIRTSVQGLATETASPTWDFANIQDQLATLYNVKPGGDYDAKPNVLEKGNRASMIHKAISARGLVPAAGGFIPNFAMTEGQVMERIRQYKDDELRSPNGVRTQIAHSGLSAPVKQRLNNKLADAVKAKQAAREQKTPGAKIDGKQLATMLVPAIGTSAGKGEAHPLPADRALLEKWLNKNYHLQSGGIKFKDLSKREQDKVYKGVKVSFPVNAANKGSASTLVDDVGQAMEMETKQFISSLKGANYAGTANVDKYLDTHKGEIAGAAGAVFESGVKSSFDLPAGKTSDRFDTTTEGHAGLRDVFGVNTPWADFKIEDNSPLRQDMASKILKHKMKARRGFIPGFADPNRMRESMQAGVPYGQTYTSFVDTQKYTGPVVGNKKDEPTYKALKDAVSIHKDPKNAGKRRGFIPGFAEDTTPAVTPHSITSSTLKAGSTEGAIAQWDALMKKLQAVDQAALAPFIDQLRQLQDQLEILPPLVVESTAAVDGFVTQMEAVATEIEGLEGKAEKKGGIHEKAEKKAEKSASRVASLKGERSREERNREGIMARSGTAATAVQKVQANLATAKPTIAEGRHQAGGGSYQFSDAMVTGYGKYKGSTGHEAIKSMGKGVSDEAQQAYNEVLHKAVAEYQEMIANGESKEVAEAKYLSNLEAVNDKLKEYGLRLTEAKGVGVGKGDVKHSVAGAPRGVKETGMERVQQAITSGGHIYGTDEVGDVLKGAAAGSHLGQKGTSSTPTIPGIAAEEVSEIAGSRKSNIEALEREVEQKIQKWSDLQEESNESWDKIQGTSEKIRKEEEKSERLAGDANSLATEIEAIEEQIKTLREKELKLDQDKLGAQIGESTDASKNASAEREQVKINEKQAQIEADITKAKQEELAAAAKARGEGGQKWQAQKHGVFQGMKSRGQLGGVLKGEKIYASKADEKAGKQMSLQDFGFRGDQTAEAQQSLQMAQGQSRQALQNAAMTAAFTLPMVTQTASQFFDKDTDTGRKGALASEAIGGIGSFAAMGAAGGLPGIIGMGAVGMFLEMPKILKGWEDETDKFNKRAELAKVKLTEWNNASQQYVKSLSEFQAALTDTTGKVTAEDMLKKQENLQKAMILIPEEFQAKMFKAQGNVEKIQEIFGEIQVDMQRRAEAHAAAAKIEEMIEEKEGDRGHDMWEGDTGKDDRNQLFQMVKATVDFRKLVGKEGEALASSLKKASLNIHKDASQFFHVLEKMGVPQEVMSRLRKIHHGNAANLEMMAIDFQTLGDEAVNAAGNFKQLSTEIKMFNERMESVLKRQQQYKELMKEAQDEFVRFSEMLVQRLQYINSEALLNVAGQRKALLTKAKGQVQASGPFTDVIMKQQLNAQLKIAELQSKQQGAVEKLDFNLRTNMVKVIGDSFHKLTGRVDKTAEQQTEGQRETNRLNQRNLDLRTRFGQILLKAVDAASRGADARGIKQLVEGMLGKEFKVNEGTKNERILKMDQQEQRKIQRALEKQLEKGNQDLSLLAERSRQEQEQLKINNHYQQIIAENTKKISQFGPINDFLQSNDSGMKRVVDIFAKQALATQSGSSTRTGANGLGVLSLLRNVVGVGGGSLPKGMRSRGVESVRSQMEAVLDTVMRETRGAGQMTPGLEKELEQIRDNLGDIAETKVAALLKDVPTHLQEIRNVLESVEKKTLGDIETEKAFERALVSTLGGKSKYLRDPLLEIQGLLAFQQGIDSMRAASENMADKTSNLRSTEGTQQMAFATIVADFNKFANVLPASLVNSVLKSLDDGGINIGTGQRLRRGSLSTIKELTGANMQNFNTASQQKIMQNLAPVLKAATDILSSGPGTPITEIQKFGAGATVLPGAIGPGDKEPMVHAQGYGRRAVGRNENWWKTVSPAMKDEGYQGSAYLLRDQLRRTNARGGVPFTPEMQAAGLPAGALHVLEEAIVTAMEDGADRVRTIQEETNEESLVAGQESAVDWAGSTLSNLLPAINTMISKGWIKNYADLEDAIMLTQTSNASQIANIVSSGRILGEDNDVWDPNANAGKGKARAFGGGALAWKGNPEIRIATIKEVAARIWQTMGATADSPSGFPMTSVPAGFSGGNIQRRKKQAGAMVSRFQAYDDAARVNAKANESAGAAVGLLNPTFNEHKLRMEELRDAEIELREETDLLTSSFSLLSSKIYRGQMEAGMRGSMNKDIESGLFKDVRNTYGGTFQAPGAAPNALVALLPKLKENIVREVNMSVFGNPTGTEVINGQTVPSKVLDPKDRTSINPSKIVQDTLQPGMGGGGWQYRTGEVDAINKYVGKYEQSVLDLALANDNHIEVMKAHNLRQRANDAQSEELDKSAAHRKNIRTQRADYVAQEKSMKAARGEISGLDMGTLEGLDKDMWGDQFRGLSSGLRAALELGEINIDELIDKELAARAATKVKMFTGELRQFLKKGGAIKRKKDKRLGKKKDVWADVVDPLSIMEGGRSVFGDNKFETELRDRFGKTGKGGDAKFKELRKKIKLKQAEALLGLQGGVYTPQQQKALTDAAAKIVMGRADKGKSGEQGFATLLKAQIDKLGATGVNVDDLFREFLKSKASLNSTDIENLKKQYAEGLADAVSPEDTDDLKAEIDALFDELKKAHGEGIPLKNIRQYASAVTNANITQQNYFKGMGTSTDFINAANEKLQAGLKNMDQATVKQRLAEYYRALGAALVPMDMLAGAGAAASAAAPGATRTRADSRFMEGDIEWATGRSLLGIDADAAAKKYQDLYNAGKITKGAVSTLTNAELNFKNAQDNYTKEIISSADLINAATTQLDAQIQSGTFEDTAAAYQKMIEAYTTGKGGKDMWKDAKELFAQSAGLVTRGNIGGLGEIAKRVAAKYNAMSDQGGRHRLTGNQKSALGVAETKVRALEGEASTSLEELAAAYREYYNAARGTNARISDKITNYRKALEAQFGTKQSRGRSGRDAIEEAHLNAAGGFGSMDEMDKYTSATSSQMQKLKAMRAESLLSRDEFLASIKAEIDYKKAVRDLAEGRTTSGEFKAVADAALKAKRISGAKGADDFWRSFKARFKYGKNEAVWAMQDMVLGMVDTFESEMNSALFNLITGAKTAKEAFKDLADAMLDEITRMAIQAAVRATMGNVFAALGNKGGAAESLPVKKFSRGGSVVGGSGMRDDVPAMLSSGEYVINKNAVRKFGAGYFAKLNESATNGAVVKLASGGDPGTPTSVEVPEGEMGQSMYARLKAKYGKRFTDYSGPAGGYYIDPEDARDHPNDKSYRNYSLDPSGRMSKSDAVRRSGKMGWLIEQDLMYGGRDPSSGLTTSYRGSGTGVDAVFRNAMVYGDRTHPESGKLEMDRRLSKMALADPNNPMNKMRMNKQKGFFDYAESQRKEMEDYRGRLDQAAKAKRDRWRQTFYTLAMIAGMGALGSLAGGGGGGLGDIVMRQDERGRPRPFGRDPWQRVASGGRMTGGDNIPALLMGGEYVMSRRSVDTYGRGFFDKLNRGEAPGFAEGGLVTDGSGTSDSPVGGSSFSGADHTNNINITVNVDGNGNATNQGVLSTSVGGDRSSDRGGKAFAQQLESAVVKVISDQKRQGGLLSKQWMKRRG